MLSRAPVALRWTRMSFDFASRVKGTSAPDFAILFLFSSEVGSDVSCKVAGECCGERTVRCEVGDAPDGVALDLHIWREHLTDEGFESTELDDRELVLAYDRTRARQNDSR